MPATFIDQITDDMITARLAQAEHAGIEWTGHMPADSESLSDQANERLQTLTADDVRPELQHHLAGETPTDEIDMAISIACEPAHMPEGGIVVVRYSED